MVPSTSQWKASVKILEPTLQYLAHKYYIVIFLFSTSFINMTDYSFIFFHIDLNPRLTVLERDYLCSFEEMQNKSESSPSSQPFPVNLDPFSFLAEVISFHPQSSCFSFTLHYGGKATAQYGSQHDLFLDDSHSCTQGHLINEMWRETMICVT